MRVKPASERRGLGAAQRGERDRVVKLQTVESWRARSSDDDDRELCLYDADVLPSTGAARTTQFFPTSQEAAMRSDWGSHAVACWRFAEAAARDRDPKTARLNSEHHVSLAGKLAILEYTKRFSDDAPAGAANALRRIG